MIEVAELTQLPAQWHRLAAAGVAGLDGQTLADLALTARRMRELADHLEVTALGALDRDGYADEVHGTTTASWFATHARISPAAARAQLAAARLLEKEMAPAGHAWHAGRITRDHLQVLLGAANPRIRDQIAHRLDELIDALTTTRFDVWKDHVKALTRDLDQDGIEPDDPTRTTASWARSDEFAQLRAAFGNTDAEVVEQILEAKTNELFRQQANDLKQFPDMVRLTRNQLRGHAIVALLIESQATDPATSKPPKVAVHLVLRAAGLPDLHADTPSGPDNPDNPDNPAEPGEPGESNWPGWPDLSAATEATWSITNPDGRRLHPASFTSLLCGADIHPLLVDAHGNPLKLGRTVRLATAKQRRVVLIRDGGCIFPGCDSPVGWADIHHVVFYDDGGPTDIDNLAATCRRHHGVAHRNGWSLTATGDGWFIWQTPTGARHWSQRHGTQRAGPLPNRAPPPAPAQGA